MTKLKRRYDGYGFLRTVSYLIGFPLMLVLVVIGSMPFMSSGAYGSTKWYPALIVLALWLAVTLLQIVFSAVCKNFKGRAFFCAFLSVVFLIGGAFAFDLYAEKKLGEIEEKYSTGKYADYDIEVTGYNDQVMWFIPFTDKSGYASKYGSAVSDFCDVYNIGITSSVEGGTNTDGSEYVKDEELDVALSANGNYADGYEFGIKEATRVLTTYYEIRNKFAADKKNEGKDIDEELDKLLIEMETATSGPWYEYKQTKVYTDAYGKNGSAYKYMLNEDRLNEILSALGANLHVSFGEAFSMLESFSGLVKGALGIEDGTEMSARFDEVWENLPNYVSEDLSVNTAVDILNALDFGPTLGLCEEGELVTVKDLMTLVNGFSYYYEPSVKPIFFFIEDKDMALYAQARYAATEHGKNVGCILIGDRLGKITLEDKGTPGEEGYSLEEIYQLQCDMEYKGLYYPLFLARRYMYIFGGFIAFSYFLVYHFGHKRKEAFAEIENNGMAD